MMRKYGRRMFAALLTACMLLAGCGAAPAGDSTGTEEQEEVPEVTEPAGPRYQVE